MIPSLVVDEVRNSLIEYLGSTFALTDDDVRGDLTSFLQSESEGIFRGPYLRVRTPFVSVDDSWMSRPPLDWLPGGFRPYAHQALAFDRLSNRDRAAEPTIVTTGTGSGKTECFLYPILDHCARMRAQGQKGIKAIILYPMNALATDQAGRIAATIAANAELAGVTAGLFIGGDGGNKSMTDEHIVDDNDILRSDPPDILLTNYKMLDFLLLRARDQDLWASNEPDTLRYLVLDEFHTYDGAQGTDVAMLLRRLGRTLEMAEPGRPLGNAVPVATSATLASDPKALTELREFAFKVFGTVFDEASIIGEQRQPVDEVCKDVTYNLRVPRVDDLLEAQDVDDVVAAVMQRYDDDEDKDVANSANDLFALGAALLKHPLTRAIVAAVSGQPRPWRSAVDEIVRGAPEWGLVAMRDPERVDQALARYLWLISIARRDVGGREMPLFTVEVQLWVREVSRLLRSVEDDQNRFRWEDSTERDSDEAPPELELPSISCKFCGMAGWMAIRSELGTTMICNSTQIYRQSISRAPTLRALIRTHATDPEASWFNPASRSVVDGPGDGILPVLITANDDDAKADKCPACGERNAIRFLGLRVASLTSVSINTLFASEHMQPEERKLLAFTDSVQDASHRASFFAGRTHRINLRSVMSQIVQERESLTLNELGDELFLRADTAHQRYAVVPPDLLRDRYVRTVWTDKPDGGGLEILRERLGFEADLEFGLRTRVGRTIELSDAAAANVPVEDSTVELVLEDIQASGLELPGKAPVEMWLRGMLERLRFKGAIGNELLGEYMVSGGKQWHVWGGRLDGLPPFGPGVGRPTFATLAPKSNDFDSLTAMSANKTWFLDWATKVLEVEPAEAKELNRRLYPLLASGTELIQTWESSSGRVFGLRRDAIEIHDLPNEEDEWGLQCDTCGGRHVVPPVAFDWWDGAACFRYRCQGKYQAHPGRPSGYYRKLYRSGITRRVVTGEHTGLLGRTEREELEERFKKGTAPDDENVLTATPTLEMGIDIGDLSAVLLTSVPRTPAAYLQRVGRAGRATGNSFVATFVPTDRHGLYYLAEPESMLAGEVRPPNCYLDAVDTLRRQYIAYLIDRTATGEIDAVPLPNQIGALLKKNALDDGQFIHAIINASMHETTWVGSFLALFDGQLATTTVDEIRHFAGSGIETRFKEAFELWDFELREQGNRIKRLNTALEKAETLAEHSGDDAEVRDLRGQRRGISDAINERRNEYTLSGLGRLGLLPNYTLVEDSTTLSASLWSQDVDGEFQSESFDYRRAGSMAVREFAPGNSFYASGHRHVVDRLEVGAIDEPNHEDWRLCPECGYGAADQTENPTRHCPRCGEVRIMGVEAKHRMLRLRQVYAAAPEERARVFDETDNRRQESYDLLTTVDVDPAYVEGAWKLTGDEVPAFGAEFARNAVFRTLNLGFRERAGTKQRIAGQEAQPKPFSTCRHCGTVQDVDDGKGAPPPEGRHQGWCKVRSGAISKEGAFEELVLYHELITDAVRMILPVSMFEVSERLASFKGVLMLGLRKDFGGDPDHLRVATTDMPNDAGQGRRNFVVLYDRVPGGTGYLDRMADPERVKAILQKGREVVERCSCQLEGRRACHKCLLGVVERREYDLVSRAAALRTVDQLFESWKTEPVGTVADIDLGRTEESELERRFKVALQEWCNHPANEHLTISPRAGKHGFDAFELRVDTEDGASLRWHIEEQEGLARISTLPDFIIRRVDDQATPVAIYLDGFEFHASAKNPNMADDAEKRAAVRVDGYHVWNLTWGDVEAFHSAAAKDGKPAPALKPLLRGTGLNAAKSCQAQFSGGLDFVTAHRNPVELLIEYLTSPDQDRWSELGLSAVTGLLAGAGERGNLSAENALRTLGSFAEGTDLTFDEDGSFAIAGVGQTLNGMPIAVALRLDDPSALRYSTIASLPDDALSVADVETHRPRWQDWLQWSNILQFVSVVGRDVLITTTSSDHSALDRTYLASAVEQPNATGDAPSKVLELSQDALEELDLLADDAVRDLVTAALERGAPDVAAGLEHESGEVLEAGWRDKKVAVVPDDWEGTEPEGWTIQRPSSITVEELIYLLEGSN